MREIVIDTETIRLAGTSPATALFRVDQSDPYGGPVWYLHHKTNDIGSDREPKSVIAHNGDFYENPNDREHHYKEREHSSPKQSVEGPITNHIGSRSRTKKRNCSQWGFL
jgi:hypothetical protein